MQLAGQRSAEMRLLCQEYCISQMRHPGTASTSYDLCSLARSNTNTCSSSHKKSGCHSQSFAITRRKQSSSKTIDTRRRRCTLPPAEHRTRMMTSLVPDLRIDSETQCRSQVDCGRGKRGESTNLLRNQKPRYITPRGTEILQRDKCSTHPVSNWYCCWRLLVSMTSTTMECWQPV